MTESDKVYGCGCPACYKFYVTDDRKLFDLYGTIPDYKFDKLMSQSLKEVKENCPVLIEKRALLPKKTTHKGNGAKNGAWCGTLTMSPSDSFNEEDMIMAIKKILTQKTSPVQKYAWYLEYTENGLPHIHFCYKRACGGRILQKVFKRQWSIWDESTPCGAGHRGGYHRLMADEDGYIKYIKKDGGRGQDSWTV